MAQERLVRPGQEALLSEMLGRGAILPGPCTFTDGQIDGAVITASYACPTCEVVVELREPGHAPAIARTEKFAIAVRGTAPADFLDALQTLIRTREREFFWSSPARDGGTVGGPSNDGTPADTSSIVAFAVVLLGVGAAAAFWRAWKRCFRGAGAVTWRAVRRTGALLLGVATVALAAEVTYRIAVSLAVPRHPAGAAFELYGVGESTMVGEPFEPKISVPRLLEHMFGGTLAGGRIVVTNLAERGAPLYPQSAAFERALAARHADAPGVVLIMSGHNEAFNPAVSGPSRPYVPSFLADRSAIIRDVLLALRRRRLIGRERSVAVYEYYLRHVLETAQANGLVPILTTMASNISRIEPNADASADWVAPIVEEGRALEARQQYAAARDLYLSRLTTDPSAAVLSYRAGRCAEALGNFEAAREYYWTAVDQDPRLLFGRATRMQNELVRRLAREYGIPLVDGVRILEDHSPHGILGDELFMDGQHPTLAGYLYLANAFAGILSDRFDTPVRHPLRDAQEAAAALGFGSRDLPAALVGAGSWLIATSVNHPFPHDRMALAEQRFTTVLGNGDDFSAWVGIGLAQATARGGLLRSPDDVRALGGLIGYPKSYSVPADELPSLLSRFEKFGVDARVVEQLRMLGARGGDGG